ncbi:MAG: DUF3488 and transglutaminase-like domain-containing protein [Opitutaceae bacterium]|nr:DUF3488 and transglutaminase-like domain-containing protein [Opitutaceae bacterium]
MVKKRPQLNTEELRQIKWFLGSLLAVIAAWSVCQLAIDARFWVTTIFLTAPVVILWPSIPARIPQTIHRLSFPAVVVYFLFDFYTYRQPFPTLVRVELMLIFLRLIAYRRSRDDFQLIVLGLLLVIASGVYAGSPLFVVQILLFTLAALGVLLLSTIVDSTETDVDSESNSAHSARDVATRSVPLWASSVNWPRLLRRTCSVLDWRIFLLGSLLFGGLMGASCLLFLAIPRFEVGANFLLDSLISKKTRTGFSDTVTFGDVTDIQEDDSIAMTVDVSDPSLLPGVPYWRMVVLDEYSENGFKTSAELNRQLLESAHDQVQSARGWLRSANEHDGVWSIFFEPGVSRHLPLGGAFGQIVFSRPLSFSFNRPLRLIELKSEPSELIGYRIYNHQMNAVLRDPVFAARGKKGGHGPGFMRMRVDVESDRILRSMVRVATGEASLTAEEFARRVCDWLWAGHSYSLRSTLPPGNGDPLIRWLQSDTPGHCEYFAGSFALLANAAGHPVRIITGFKGGDWNAFSNSMIVRHTHAHAWCEIWNGRDAWIRVDPTPGTAAAVGEPDKATAAAEIAGRVVDDSWRARLDGLRVFWFRRVISFDQQTQGEITAGTLRGVDRAVAWLGHISIKGFDSVRDWLLRPWSTRRLVIHSLLLVAASLAFWLVSAARRSWAWRVLFSWRSLNGGDPVRKEASRWLQRIRSAPPSVRNHPQVTNARAQLERLRFGPGSARVNASGAFSIARRSMAAAKRAARH